MEGYVLTGWLMLVFIPLVSLGCMIWWCSNILKKGEGEE